MKKLTGYEIRKMWLDFFHSKNHEIIPSASLVPVNDPTLLWINAGVAPLKKYFDGREKPNNPRMTNAQKSIRTNDIDNVGKTARHHTFFEMLGNFSIGDYFRDEVIPWAYELLFSEKYFAFDKNLIYITYYPKDLDTFNKWVSVGISSDHLIALEDNFWEIGEGPCGPDTEIFFDRGPKYDPNNLGIKMLQEDIENDRYIEIWNIVFSQFNSKTGLARENYPELPSKNIDTGSGLERLTCVMQEVETNYDSDLFAPIMDFLSEYTHKPYQSAIDKMPYRVIADHIRTLTFALADGAMISNEGRGYVLRRILRRALRYGRKLQIEGAFLYKMVKVVIDKYSDFYPYLIDKQTYIEKIIKQEEESFLKTLESGEKRLLEIISKSDNHIIKGSDAFLLYDTYGFPLELTLEAALEKGYQVDENGFKEELSLQKERARKARSEVQSMNSQNEDYLAFTDESKFIGYDTLKSETKVIAVFKDGKKVNNASGLCDIVTKETPFYATMGGQESDEGIVLFDNSSYEVIDCFRLPNGQHAHSVDFKEQVINTGDSVILEVDEQYRNLTCKNHSATHLLNEALRTVLGKHVSQQGSLVNGNHLRFDFNHFENVKPDELIQIEQIVNDQIALNSQTKTEIMPLEKALKSGAQAMFGEKYGKEVRVVKIGFSTELCGGTHVKNSGDIKKFAITSLESKGSGIYRVDASVDVNIEPNIATTISGFKKDIENNNQKIATINAKLKDHVSEEISLPILNGSYQDILNMRMAFENSKKALHLAEKTYNDKMRLANANSNDFVYDLITNNGNYSYLVTKIENTDATSIKDLVDNVANKIDKGVVFIAGITDEKIIFVCKVKNVEFNAGSLVKEAAIICDGNGGGRPDFAQAGGKNIAKVDESLAYIKNKVA